MLDNDLYFAAHILDPRVKFSLIREQYSNNTNDIIKRVKTYFKTQYLQSISPVTQIQPYHKRPYSIPIYEWNLLYCAQQLNASESQQSRQNDFDRYFDDPPVTSYEPVKD